MSDTAPPLPAARLLGLTAQIVAAHASHNQVAPDDLPRLITSVHRTLGGLGQDQASPPVEAPPREPAVPIRRSVRPDRITCLECGVKMKMLKRHLATEHGLTPDSYRERWGLKRDYPMVAADYAETRSGLAKQSGLGRKRNASGAFPVESQAEPEPQRAASSSVAQAAPEAQPVAPAPKRRGRPPRAKVAAS